MGLHWSMILGAIGKRKKNGGSALKVPVNVLRAGGAAVAIYGLYAFIKNQYIWQLWGCLCSLHTTEKRIAEAQGEF